MTKRVAALCAALISFVVFLILALWGATFRIDGGATRALHPGASVPINVRISNPHFYPITVTDLTVRITKVTPAHEGETCRPANYTVTQPRRFVVRLAPFSAASMTSIASMASGLPTLKLSGINGRIDDGCQGATLELAYSASGNWWSR